MTDDTGEPDARKPARPVRGRGVEKVPLSDGNSSASYPTSRTFACKLAGCTQVSILDWYSRFVVSWALDQTMQIAFVMEAMQRALERATPQICHSNQGSQFTSPQYTPLLLSHKVRISMDSKGRALDNIFTERLWRTLKDEEVYVKDYASPREARHELRDYLRFYNEQRIHQALDSQTPAEVYFARRW